LAAIRKNSINYEDTSVPVGDVVFGLSYPYRPHYAMMGRGIGVLLDLPADANGQL